MPREQCPAELVPVAGVGGVIRRGGGDGLPGEAQRLGERRRILAVVPLVQQQPAEGGESARAVGMVHWGSRQGLPGALDRVVEVPVFEVSVFLEPQVKGAVDPGEIMQAKGAGGMVLRQCAERLLKQVGRVHSRGRVVGAPSESLHATRQVHQPGDPVDVPVRGAGQRLLADPDGLDEYRRVP